MEPKCFITATLLESADTEEIYLLLTMASLSYLVRILERAARKGSFLVVVTFLPSCSPVGLAACLFSMTGFFCLDYSTEFQPPLTTSIHLFRKLVFGGCC